MEKMEGLCLDIFLQNSQVRLQGLATMNRNRRQEADLSTFALFDLINILFI